MIALFFFGTTEETKTVVTFLARKIRRSDAAVSLAVGTRIGFARRCLVEKASFV